MHPQKVKEKMSTDAEQRKRFAEVVDDTRLTNAALAAKMGMDAGNLGEIINGKIQSLTYSAVRKLCRVTLANPAWIMEGQGPKYLPTHTLAAEPEEGYNLAPSSGGNLPGPIIRTVVELMGLPERISDLERRVEKLEEKEAGD